MSHQAIIRNIFRYFSTTSAVWGYIAWLKGARLSTIPFTAIFQFFKSVRVEDCRLTNSEFLHRPLGCKFPIYFRFSTSMRILQVKLRVNVEMEL